MAREYEHRGPFARRLKRSRRQRPLCGPVGETEKGAGLYAEISFRDLTRFAIATPAALGVGRDAGCVVSSS